MKNTMRKFLGVLVILTIIFTTAMNVNAGTGSQTINIDGKR